MDLRTDGAQRVSQALSAEELAHCDELARRHNQMSAGVRLIRDPALSRILAKDRTMDRIAKSILGSEAKPVRAILFDKRSDINWTLGWHQDRTIAVRKRIEVPGFGPWSKKLGIDHVEPPFELIEQMITLRAHLDECTQDNGPLKILSGSHRFGRVPVHEIDDLAKKSEIKTCLANRGEIWIYASSIIHASEASKKSMHRRVLHVDYAAAQLPRGLEWYGIEQAQ